MEHAERPSNKELQLFTILNQAFGLIGAENITVIFNKCPDAD
jgi:hypothetical protein